MAITPGLEKRMEKTSSNSLVEVTVKLVDGTDVDAFRQSLPALGLKGGIVRTWHENGFWPFCTYSPIDKYMITGVPEEIRALEQEPQVEEVDAFHYRTGTLINLLGGRIGYSH